MDRRSLFLLSFLLPVAILIPLALRAFVEEATFPTELTPRVLPSVVSAPKPSPHPVMPFGPPLPLAAPSRPRHVASSQNEARILELMSRNATCPLLQSRLTQRAPISFLTQLLRSGHRAGPIPQDAMDAYLHAIASPNDEAFHATLRVIPHPFLRLTEAAAYLGLLRGRNAMAAPENAISLLRVLTAELPGNAVPALLLAYALHQLRDPSYATELARALDRPTFQTFSEEALQSIYAPSVEQPTLLPAALGVADQAPLLDLLPVEDLVLDRLLDEDRSYAESALSFGRRLVRGEGARSSREDQLFWSSLNYTIGQRTGRAAWKKLHPELPMPADLSISRDRLLARSSALGKISDRHFARQEKTALNLALCEEALPRYAQGLKREWELATK